jgi:dual specificity MAP kinase phosphatase
MIVLGEAGLKKDHPVIHFLATEGRVASLGFLKDGIDAFEKEFPFLVGQSMKALRDLVYPTPIQERSLFLGTWTSASDVEKLNHLKISRLVTIHNDPKSLKLPGVAQHDQRRDL